MAEEKKQIKTDDDTVSDTDKPNVKIKIGDHKMEAEFRTFKSGKTGYGCYGTFKINNWPCRLSLNLIEM